MANITQIQNILQKAKEGQFISLKCEGSSTDFFAEVVQLGTDKVQAVKAEDWEEGWPKDEPTDLGPLCFTAEEPGSTVRFDSMAEGTPLAMFDPNMNMQYSRDGQTWTVMDLTQPPSDFTLTNVGDKLYFKAVTANPHGFNYMGPQCCWKMTGKIAASGNIQYLLTSDGSRTDVPVNCYNEMFYDCTSLTQAPELPAKTLASSCYYNMFFGCSSLTTAPNILPAETLVFNCYGGMFQGCTSLSAAPELPATTLAEICYGNMFLGCTSLTSAPELPATTLASNCYSLMFSGCTRFSDCHMKAEMQGVYNPSMHGDTYKTVVYDL